MLDAEQRSVYTSRSIINSGQPKDSFGCWLLLTQVEFDCRRTAVWILLEGSHVREEEAGSAGKVNFYYCVVSEHLESPAILTTCMYCSVT